ncbi:hypothetical protein NDU88_002563 [Pleurodeles waltl]|uniref:Uncharacterized protein n=1 Tax=Pleurodeles waltl TaxID=8319 RepID=A0AAV7V041_PLEWA|nr:hypothetical protein NDU88_002563 [Pleurodeles waltl]
MTPALVDVGVNNATQAWEPARVVTIGDFYAKGQLLTFKKLEDSFGLHKGQLLTYRALRVANSETWGSGLKEPVKSKALITLLTRGMQRKGSNMYTLGFGTGILWDYVCSAGQVGEQAGRGSL